MQVMALEQKKLGAVDSPKTGPLELEWQYILTTGASGTGLPWAVYSERPRGLSQMVVSRRTHHELRCTLGGITLHSVTVHTRY